MLLALYMLSISNNDQTIDTDNAGGGSFDAIKNSLQINEIRNIASYVWIWTALMTVHGLQQYILLKTGHKTQNKDYDFLQ